MNKVAGIRAAKGLSMQKLADLCEPPTTASQINKLEKEHVILSSPWKRRLADALQCHPLDLADEGDEWLDAKERELLNIFRFLTPGQQDALLATVGALAETQSKSATHQHKPMNGVRAPSDHVAPQKIGRSETP